MTTVGGQRAGNPVELAGWLRALRQRAGLSQTAVARATSISQAQLSRIEQGAATPTAKEVGELAQAYAAAAEERDRLIAAAAAMATQFVDSRVVLQKGNTHNFQKRVRETEAKAARVQSYQPALVQRRVCPSGVHAARRSLAS